jgi:hypothetical protein
MVSLKTPEYFDRGGKLQIAPWRTPVIRFQPGNQAVASKREKIAKVALCPIRVQHETGCPS